MSNRDSGNRAANAAAKSIGLRKGDRCKLAGTTPWEASWIYAGAFRGLLEFDCSQVNQREWLRPEDIHRVAIDNL